MIMVRPASETLRFEPHIFFFFSFFDQMIKKQKTVEKKKKRHTIVMIGGKGHEGLYKSRYKTKSGPHACLVTFTRIASGVWLVGFGLANFVRCLIYILSFFSSGMFDGGVITYPKKCTLKKENGSGLIIDISHLRLVVEYKRNTLLIQRFIVL